MAPTPALSQTWSRAGVPARVNRPCAVKVLTRAAVGPRAPLGVKTCGIVLRETDGWISPPTRRPNQTRASPPHARAGRLDPPADARAEQAPALTSPRAPPRDPGRGRTPDVFAGRRLDPAVGP